MFFVKILVQKIYSFRVSGPDGKAVESVPSTPTVDAPNGGSKNAQTTQISESKGELRDSTSDGPEKIDSESEDTKRQTNGLTEVRGVI